MKAFYSSPRWISIMESFSEYLILEYFYVRSMCLFSSWNTGHRSTKRLSLSWIKDCIYTFMLEVLFMYIPTILRYVDFIQYELKLKILMEMIAWFLSIFWFYWCYVPFYYRYACFLKICIYSLCNYPHSVVMLYFSISFNFACNE